MKLTLKLKTKKMKKLLGAQDLDNKHTKRIGGAGYNTDTVTSRKSQDLINNYQNL
ncbi:hypothetical protein [Pseudoalteromonas aurantia]|uniref:hypothetical protein n=1 Tax=Pseudoalteromonas aurantia TaxID=43654 RepID=UPI001486E80E|nr:hypothetical protein [Pseudoalteromonas aurantia]